MTQDLFTSVTQILKLPKPKEQALARLGISSLKDLLLYRPSYYKTRLLFPDLSLVKHNDEIVTKIKITDISWPKKKGQPIKMQASNQSGSLTLIFFSFSPFMKSSFFLGAEKVIAGKVEFFDFYKQISHPELIFDIANITAREPIYSLTYGLTNVQLWGYIIKAVKALPYLAEWLPPELIKQNELISFKNAIGTMHALNGYNCPLEKAEERLKIDEIFANQLALRLLRQQRKIKEGRSFTEAKEWKEHLLTNLGFTLTEGQQQAISEIEDDMSSPEQMLRMVQGDVGCGKTLVALLTALNVIKSQAQVAFMAPTDILAQQHYYFISKALEHLPIKVLLLTGKIQGKKRNEILTELKDGDANIIIGTHALFQEKVQFKDLGYIIVDEQHRFGVKQRLELISKGKNPDILIMSATPIPRSLTITMFGDMACSRITTMPQGRQPIQTLIVNSNKLEEIIAGLTKKLAVDERIYWICPLIEEQELDQKDEYTIANVEQRFNDLNQCYPGQVGLLHGKMTADIKEQAMQQFKAGQYKVLVATTVIEVGVDVSEATTIIIENAEKFGLAQLHQLRGRVGRGHKASICILLYGKFLSATARERLRIMKSSHDGFYIAEQDLKLRGGGGNSWSKTKRRTKF